MHPLRPLLPVVLTFVLLIGGLWFGFGRYLQSATATAAASGADAGAPGRAVIARTRNGTFRGVARINGVPLAFIADTGASLIAIDDQDADRLGLTRGRVVRLRTANGLTTGYATRLRRVQVGGVRVDDARAVIVPNLDGPMLLGNSFLRHFEIRATDKAMKLTLPASN